MLWLAEALAQVGEFGAVLRAITRIGPAFAPLLFDVFREQREFRLDLVEGNRDAAQAQFGLDGQKLPLQRVLAEAGLGEFTKRTPLPSVFGR